VEDAAQATMDICRPGETSQTERSAGQTEAQLTLTGWALEGSLSGMFLQPLASAILISNRD
jgi:hypothetical protein